MKPEDEKLISPESLDRGRRKFHRFFERLREFHEQRTKVLKELKSGKPLKVTEVTREETLDGPLHTFEEKLMTLDE